MRCVDDCHNYELEGYLGQSFQTLRFYKLDKDGVPAWDGVQNEEVLAVLIHRMKVLNKNFPCTENLNAIKNLEGAQVWLTLRTQDRKVRGVEGKHEL